MRDHAEANGVRFHLESPVTCVQRSHRRGVQFEVRTPGKLFLVRKFLFLAIPTVTLMDRTAMDGDVLRDLDLRTEFNRSMAQEVASVVMQWPPGSPAWFW